MRALGRRVASFRKANSIARDTFPEALEDVDAFTCSRLGNDPKWCRDNEASFAQVHAYEIIPVKPCAGCGAKL